MRTIDPARSTLLVIDEQERLIPAIDGGAELVETTRRLVEAALLLGVPVIATEHYPKGLGATVEGAGVTDVEILSKRAFDATRESGFAGILPAERPDFVVVGCEAHVCVMQTVLGLLDGKRRVHVVADALGSREPMNKQVAVDRMARHGADIVTSEMVMFEWLQTSEHPQLKAVLALIR